MMASRDRCVFLSLFFLLSLTSLPPPRRAKDTLEPGESIADGQTLVSAGSIFELGFFSPSSSTNRYVGIWYYDFSIDTVLWVANREAPIPDASGSLSVGDDGNLSVLDGSRSVVWSTNASSPSNASTTTTILQLLDTGNLVLNISGGVAWQSFDHPTDTYLPGMRIGLNLDNNVNQLFTSRRSPDDPAPGNFSMGMDPRRSTQIFLWEGGKPRWRSGRWNGQVFIGIPGMVPKYIYGFWLSNFQQEHKMYFYYNALNSSHRYVLTWNGIEEHLIWKNETKGWFQQWAQPVTECEHYNRCGNNGRCTDGVSAPECTCLHGYVPAAAEEWGEGNRTGGCVRRTALQCERNGSVGGGGADGFWKMEGVKLPDLSEWDADVVDEDGCRAACLGNCSCTAYASVEGIRCLVWGGDLVDVHVFSAGGNDLYLRLASSELENENKMPKFVIVLINLAVIIAIGFMYLLFKYNKRIRVLCFRRRSREVESVNPSADRDQTGGTTSFHIMQESNDPKCQEQLPLLSFELILTSTSGFSSENFLGEGGFGPVYKGTLPEGQEVAIKRLSRSSGQGQNEFKNEVILIAKLQHRNLVRLLGCCIEGEEKLLVYEYMPNKSLDVFLFDPGRKWMLGWKIRYNIVEGIARGLVYLHRDSRLRIIHRDLKASNILLDKDMDPKISDFGMARIFGSEQNETNTTKVMGTFGYMSPEYAMQGVFSVKSDVYSYGVLLLEIVSGRKNSSFVDEESSLSLIGYAWKLWNEDNVMEFVDPTIRDSCSREQVSRCVNVGLLCVQDQANARPKMSAVIIMLERGTAANQQPMKPTFAAEMGHSDHESSLLDHMRSTSTNKSISLLVGR